MDGFLEVAVGILGCLEFVIADDRRDHSVFCYFQSFLVLEHFKDVFGVPSLVLHLNLKEYLFNFGASWLLLV